MYRKDYEPPTYVLPKVDLAFELDAERTTVRSRLYFKRNGKANSDLVLDGHNMELSDIQIKESSNASARKLSVDSLER